MPSHAYMTAMISESSTLPYAHPPIVEAIVEVRLAAEANEAKQKKANNRIAGRYANSSVERQIAAKIDFNGRSVTFEDKPPIYRLSSEDQTELCSLGAQSVSWVRRAPYEGWASFKKRIMVELPMALKSYGDPRIARVGLRFVNRIDVKSVDGLAHYEDYLNFRISHGDLLEPTLGFQWHLVKDFPDQGLKANVQSAVLEPEIPGFAAFSFDIDVFCDVNVPQSAENILEKLESMRPLKNLIFETGITEQARKAYS